MKFYCLSDNVDTQLGFRLVGIEGKVVHERHEFLESLEELLHSKDIEVVMMTSKLVELAPEVIAELKLTLKRPLLVEIPDRHNSVNISELIDSYVASAIGIKM